MKIEAALLTGGKSSRMGLDKASLIVDGEALGERTARLLSLVSEQVTVIGRHRIPGYPFIEDSAAYPGPLPALGSFSPEARLVFLSACDLPLFDASLVTFLADRLESHPSVMAVVPCVGRRLQPLAAIYRAEAFGMISTVRAEGRDSMMAWLEALWVERVEEDELQSAGIHPVSLTSADTADTLIALLSHRSKT